MSAKIWRRFKMTLCWIVACLRPDGKITLPGEVVTVWLPLGHETQTIVWAYVKDFLWSRMAIPVIFNLLSLNCTQRITFDLLTTISHWQLMFICYFITMPSFHWPLVVFRVSAFKGPSSELFVLVLYWCLWLYLHVVKCPLFLWGQGIRVGGKLWFWPYSR